MCGNASLRWPYARYVCVYIYEEVLEVTSIERKGWARKELMFENVIGRRRIAGVG